MDRYLIYNGAMSNPTQVCNEVLDDIYTGTVRQLGISADHRRLFECGLKWTFRSKFLLLIFTLAMEEGIQVSGSFERGLQHFIRKEERSRQSCLR